MSNDLDPTQRRVVGTLVEKDLAVPETYPLTLNALVLGCNQTSNRDPATHYAEYEVSGALRALQERGWALSVEKAGARTVRWAHRVRERLEVDDVDLAMLAELLLRGPQSPGELRTRASRMRPIADVSEVERRLAALAARPHPLVRFLGRREGERAPRWADTLGAHPEAGPHGDASATAGATAVTGSNAARADGPSLADRVSALEREVARLRERLDGAGA